MLKRYDTLITRLDSLFAPRPAKYALERLVKNICENAGVPFGIDDEVSAASKVRDDGTGESSTKQAKHDSTTSVIDLTADATKEAPPLRLRSDEQLYCMCFRPKIQGDFIVRCGTCCGPSDHMCWLNRRLLTDGGCGRWYHGTCVQLTNKAVAASLSEFICPRCSQFRMGLNEYQYGHVVTEVVKAPVAELCSLMTQFKSLAVSSAIVDSLNRCTQAYASWENETARVYLEQTAEDIIRRGVLAGFSAAMEKGEAFHMSSTHFFLLQRLRWRCEVRQVLQLHDSTSSLPLGPSMAPASVFFREVRALWCRASLVQYLSRQRRENERGAPDFQMNFGELMFLSHLVATGDALERDARSLMKRGRDCISDMRAVVERARHFSVYSPFQEVRDHSSEWPFHFDPRFTPATLLFVDVVATLEQRLSCLLKAAQPATPVSPHCPPLPVHASYYPAAPPPPMAIPYPPNGLSSYFNPGYVAVTRPLPAYPPSMCAPPHFPSSYPQPLARIADTCLCGQLCRDGYMNVRCDSCKRTYHPSCVRLGHDALSRPFVCPRCHSR